MRIAAGGEEPFEIEILLGGLTGESSNKRYVTKTGSGWTGTAWKSSTDRLVEVTLGSLQDTPSSE